MTKPDIPLPSCPLAIRVGTALAWCVPGSLLAGQPRYRLGTQVLTLAQVRELARQADERRAA